MKQLIEKPFNIIDAQKLLDDSIEKIDVNITSDMLKSLYRSGEARTWTFKNEIIGCGGIVIYDIDKCEAWNLLNNNLVNKFKRELIISAKKFIDEMAKKYTIKYMRASRRVDFDNKWLEHLGFTMEKETEMIVGQGESYIYSRRF